MYCTRGGFRMIGGQLSKDWYWTQSGPCNMTMILNIPVNPLRNDWGGGGDSLRSCGVIWNRTYTRETPQTLCGWKNLPSRVGIYSSKWISGTGGQLYEMPTWDSFCQRGQYQVLEPRAYLHFPEKKMAYLLIFLLNKLLQNQFFIVFLKIYILFVIRIKYWYLF